MKSIDTCRMCKRKATKFALINLDDWKILIRYCDKCYYNPNNKKNDKSFIVLSKKKYIKYLAIM